MCWHIELNNSEAYIDKETGISLYIKNENEEGKINMKRIQLMI